jgi:hypothetical protein
MRRALLLFAGGLAFVALVAASWKAAHRPFAPETTPEGAYARVAFDVAERRFRDAFPYFETEAQWAAYTIRDMRKKACDRVRATYPPADAAPLLEAWQAEADAPDGADVVVLLGKERGWITRLERDLSGVDHVEVVGERATVVTARGTRYSFRRRDNGIWGMTMFTAELATEAERASRDLDVVERAAADYERAGRR